MWDRPDVYIIFKKSLQFNIRILETKVFKNPIRDAIRRIMKQKELERDVEYQKQ